MDEASLERRLLGHDVPASKVDEPPFGLVHIEMQSKGVTLALHWQEYRAALLNKERGLTRSSASTTSASSLTQTNPA
jgi:hypothetical protein